MHSPNDMMLDSQDDMIVEPTQNDADQVAIIEPDQLENGAEQLENVTLATDCASSPTTELLRLTCLPRTNAVFQMML